MAAGIKEGTLSPEEKLRCYGKAYDQLTSVEQAYVDKSIENLIARVKIASIYKTGVECRFSPTQAFEVLGAVAVFYAEHRVEFDALAGEFSFFVNSDGSLK